MPRAARSAPPSAGGGRDAGHRLTLRNEVAAVGPASEWLRSLATPGGLSDDDVYRLDLCAAELLTNIVSYAYEDERAHEIELGLAIRDRDVLLEIADDGRPFDPVAHPLDGAATSLEVGHWGGWGLRIVRQFADECRYERRGVRNVVSLVFKRQASPTAAEPAARGTDRRSNREAAAFPLRRSDGTVVEADARSGIDRRRLGFISTFEIFRGVPYHLVEDAIAGCRVRRFPDGTVLLRPGDRNSTLAFVLSGRLRIHLDAPDSPTSFTIEAGDCAGEMSVVDGLPVSAYVVADGGCRILLVGGKTLFDRLLPIPQVNRNFLSLLTDRVRRTSLRVVEQMRSTNELERLQRELGFAAEIQAGMLPHESPLFTDRPEVECAAKLRVARQVGGDFYDAFFVDHQRVLVTIGDVCGKGLPAALFMVRALTLLRSEATRRAGAKRGQLPRTVERLNRLLVERNEASLFVTMVCGVLDITNGELMFLNAGHNAPVLAAGDGPFELLAGPRNPMVGVVPDRTFAQGELTLPPGSVLVLYTDGVIDALAATGETFGEARLIAALNAAPERSTTRLIEEVMATVDRFVGDTPQADDIAVLALRYHGPAQA
jgi:serine phosphatase RsbU (regulator of sigma subunit)/anti-sigma regulatory factor (Ser/Thr protein kinase)